MVTFASMIAHVSLPVSDYERAKEFYSKALAPVGYELGMEYGEAAGFKEGGDTSFWIAKKETAEPAHVAFEAKSKEAVERFYLKALQFGATDDGAPGYRKDYRSGEWTVCARDADGHAIEVMVYDYSRDRQRMACIDDSCRV